MINCYYYNVFKLPGRLIGRTSDSDSDGCRFESYPGSQIFSYLLNP